MPRGQAHSAWPFNCRFQLEALARLTIFPVGCAPPPPHCFGAQVRQPTAAPHRHSGPKHSNISGAAICCMLAKPH